MSELTSDDGLWLHLLDGSGRTAALLEFTVRPETVTISSGYQVLAVVSCAELSYWLRHGEDPLTTDALVWTFEGHRIGISIGLRPTLLISEVFILDLMDAI